MSADSQSVHDAHTPGEAPSEEQTVCTASRSGQRHVPHEAPRRPGAGFCLMMLGAGGLLLVGLQRGGAPVPYVLGEWVILALSLGAGIVGAAWQWRDDHPRTRWAPTRPGRRFGTAVLYTRRDCPLCDEAHELLNAYSAYLPELAVVDVDEEESLRERFDTCVPVVELDGRVRFRGIISEPLLQRLIEGTPPVQR